MSVSGAHSATLAYDPLGRLWETSTSLGVTRFVYDGDRLIGEYSSGGALLRRYVHGAGVDEPLVWYEGASVSGAARRYLHADHQGSILATSNAVGATLQQNTYDAYGVPGAGNTGRFQYTGQAAIPELGLYYYKARFYNPRLGRFMQTDPIGYEDDLNLYAYVRNDPLNKRDPSGLDCEDPTTGPCETVIVKGTKHKNEKKSESSATNRVLLTPGTPEPQQNSPQGTETQCHAPYGYGPNGTPLPEPPVEPVYPELFFSGVRAAYALLTKAIPPLAMATESTTIGQAAYANAARNSLKDLGRGPLAPILQGVRQPTFSEMMARKGQDAYGVIESAGKSNATWNAAAGGAAAGAVGASPPNQVRPGC